MHNQALFILNRACSAKDKLRLFTFVLSKTFRNDAIDRIKKLIRKIFRELIACWLIPRISRKGVIVKLSFMRLYRSSFSRWTQIAEDSTTFPNRLLLQLCSFLKIRKIFLLCSLFCLLSKCGCSAMNKKNEKLLSFIAKIFDVWKNLKAIKILAVQKTMSTLMEGSSCCKMELERV